MLVGACIVCVSSGSVLGLTLKVGYDDVCMTPGMSRLGENSERERERKREIWRKRENERPCPV